MEIWDIAQDRNGILYFANDEGLLTFDGSYWKTYPLPNKAPIRSMAIDPTGRVYVGGQDEVGYFFPDQHGILRYHSLKELLPKIAQQFADIWNIIILDNAVYFRTIETIFQYKDNTMRTFDAPGGWHLIEKAGSRLYASDKTEGLYVFQDGHWEAPWGKAATVDLRITGIMDYHGDTLLVTTLTKGLYLLYGSTLVRKPTYIDALLSDDLANCARRISDDRYAIGTKSSGVFIIDGRGKLIQRFSTEEGLQNNNILRMMTDQDGNLWLGLENGVSFVNYNTAVRHICPAPENKIASNNMTICNGQLYVGTSNGLYQVPLDLSQKDFSRESGAFKEVSGTKGRVLGLREINGQLLMGHENGSFVIRDGKASAPITNRQGVWGFTTLSHSTDIVAGTYTGLQLIGDEAGRFTDRGRLNNLYESLGLLAVDEEDHIWASHPYRGLFKSTIAPPGGSPPPFIHYTTKQGLPSDINDYVYKLQGRIVAATGKGVYEYNPGTDRFSPSPFFQKIFNDSSVEYLTEDKTGNIWFVSNERVGVIDVHKRSGSLPYAVIYFPELTGQTVKGAAYIYPYDSANVFIGSYNGVIHLNYSQYIKSDTSIRVLLSAVKAIAEKDSLIFGGYFGPTGSGASQGAGDGKSQRAGNVAVQLPNHWNSFHFEYSSTLYAQKMSVEYSYRLAGFDKEWSDWSVKTEKDYTNLSYGTYTFYVRARNNLGTTSQPVAYTFTVAPAWYQSVWAYLFYFLLIAGALLFIVKWEQRRFEDHQKKYELEQERLNYLYSLELDRKEKGLIALQNEKLASELDFKNKELATVTMHLVERGGLLLNIKEELVNVIKKLNIPELSHEFKSVFRMMSVTEKNDDDWNRFAIHFDQVHNNFLTILKTKFPSLSPTDLKLCAYLRLNLSSKEIAQLLNISLKGVEISRYRIRKKFQLTPEVNLYDFLIEATR